MASLSISLDSLGVGIAVPALALPLLPLLVAVSITTTVFTLIGLSIGARLGKGMSGMLNVQQGES